MLHHDIIKHASSSHCTRCHGEGEGFKCPACGKTASHYDPDHFRNCPDKGKLRVMCKKCQKAEDHCTCA